LGGSESKSSKRTEVGFLCKSRPAQEEAEGDKKCKAL